MVWAATMGGPKWMMGGLYLWLDYGLVLGHGSKFCCRMGCEDGVGWQLFMAGVAWDRRKAGVAWYQ